MKSSANFLLISKNLSFSFFGQVTGSIQWEYILSSPEKQSQVQTISETIFPQMKTHFLKEQIKAQY